MKSSSFETDAIRTEVLDRAVRDLEGLLFPLRLIMLLNKRVHAAESVSRSLRFLAMLKSGQMQHPPRPTDIDEGITALRKLLWGVAVEAKLLEGDAVLGEVKARKAVTQTIHKCDGSFEEIAQIFDVQRFMYSR